MGRALSERRHRLGLDQKSSAEAIGISRSTYAAYEHDARRFSFDVLYPLGSFLELDIDQVLELYGATCVAQARLALFHDAFAEGVPVNERSDGGMQRRVRSEDMSVVQRVYFDVMEAHHHSSSRSLASTASEGPGAARGTASMAAIDDSDAVSESIAEVKTREKKHKPKVKDDKKRSKNKPKTKAGHSKKRGKKGKRKKKR